MRSTRRLTMGLLRICIFILAAVICSATPVVGQQAAPADTVVAEIWEAYRQLDYEQAEEKANSALETYQEFRAEQLTEIHTVLALVKFSQNRQEEARRQFEAALSLRPDLVLDSVLVSPKIQAFFEEVKQAVVQQGEGPPDQVRYLVVEDLRAPAALRSALVPGWGQLYKQEKAKGWVLMGLWGATFSGAVASHVFRARAEEAYLEETEDPERIEDLYQSFNSWHKVRNRLLLAAAGVWAYGYVDALVTGRRPDPAAGPSRRDLMVVPAPAPSYAQVYLRLPF